ncbi:hypothetical protein LINGRAHAP2_LOCUS28358 [Linum grandiflorum]
MSLCDMPSLHSPNFMESFPPFLNDFRVIIHIMSSKRSGIRTGLMSNISRIHHVENRKQNATFVITSFATLDHLSELAKTPLARSVATRKNRNIHFRLLDSLEQRRSDLLPLAKLLVVEESADLGAVQVLVEEVGEVGSDVGASEAQEDLVLHYRQSVVMS